MADDTKIVFVTVGTTSFDQLIETITKQDVIEVKQQYIEHVNTQKSFHFINQYWRKQV